MSFSDKPVNNEIKATDPTQPPTPISPATSALQEVLGSSPLDPELLSVLAEKKTDIPTIVRVLAEQKADVNAFFKKGTRMKFVYDDCSLYSDISGMTPLYVALQFHSLETIKALIDASADVNRRSSNPEQSVAAAGLFLYSHNRQLNMHDQEKLVGAMIKAKLEVDTPPLKNTPTSLLHLMIQENFNNSCAFQLLEAKANPDIIDVHGYTPAHIAIGVNNLVVLGYLIQARADLNIANTEKLTVIDLVNHHNCSTALKIIRKDEKERKDCASAALCEGNLLITDLINIVVKYMETALTFSELDQSSEQPSQGATVANEETPASNHTTTNSSTPGLN